MQQLNNILYTVQKENINPEDLVIYLETLPAVDYIKTSSTTVKLFTDESILGEEVTLAELQQYVAMEDLSEDTMVFGTEFTVEAGKVILK